MKKDNVILVSISIIMLLAIIAFATYAYFNVGNMNTTNVANLNATSERNNMVFDVVGGVASLQVSAVNMLDSVSGNMAASNVTTLTVSLQANTDYSMVCTYDIVFEWTSQDRYTAHTSGVTDNEYTIQARLGTNGHVYSGTNNISNETDISSIIGNQTSAIVVTGAKIDGMGSTTSTATWTLTSRFYNVDANQNVLQGKTYTYRFKVANVSCVSGIANLAFYWFDDYDTTNMKYQNGDMPESATTDRELLDRNVYIKQQGSNYSACAYIDTYDTEVCLSQPYTQYGIPDHVLDEPFTAEQITSITSALQQVFVDAGIPSSALTFETANDDSWVECEVEGYELTVYSSGEVDSYGSDDYCDIGITGAYCEE